MSHESSVLELIIRKHVLKNAFDFGKASAGSVVGKVIGEHPDSKKDMKSTMILINSEISRISKLTKEQIEEEMKTFTYVEKKEEVKKSITLSDAVEGKVVTRFPPEPSGYPHIGHAKAAWIDYEGAKNHGGKMILRFDDTNPEKESYQYVEAIKEGLIWLGIEWDGKETYTSDNMPKIYEASEKLIKKNKAYVCFCKQEEISKGRTEGIPCACRAKTIKENEINWKKMLEGEIQEGEAILRYSGDMESLNTVMRDPTIARILETKHYRQLTKYRVWPGYDLAVVVMDHLEGITHSMRSKEYELRDELYKTLVEDLEFRKPVQIGFSRLNIKNAPISKRLLLPLVKEGKVLGWDDPRLPTLKGLERRGILPQAIKEFVLSFGLSKVESEPSWEALLVINKKMLDPISDHYFFVEKPVEVFVEDLKEGEIEIKKNPKKQERGNRKIKVGKKIFLANSDAINLKEGETIRLKDLCNIQIVKIEKTRIVAKTKEDEQVEKKVQWVSENSEKCRILVPKDLLNENGEFDPKSLEIIEGRCEESVLEVEKSQVIQFERFGFCKMDNKEKLEFIFCC